MTNDNGSGFEPDIDAIAGAGITRVCNPPTDDRDCSTDKMPSYLVRALG